ncbi:CHAT domain-containing WD40 repeat protein [Calothrix sp. NIES-2098]|uniref:CHAT domain-containing WD40 repeat protein n=1 Tax=Calothrix sp. NIES-2098 TaxID=1954171 RepID=UPI000B60EBEA|nr:WD-40 repeat protein [Calothrix sp. NIES-2098]
MVKQIPGTLTITIKKQDENYTIEAEGPKGIKVDPQPAPQLTTLLSNQEIADTLKELSSKEPSTTTEAIQKLGKALHDSLFTDKDILLAFDRAQGSANADSGVRLRLQIEPTELAVLPWETLYDGKNWLSAQSTTPLVRKLALSENRKPLQKLQIQGALRILFVGASPENKEKLLEVEKTAKALKKLLDEPINKKQIVFDELLNANIDRLRQELLEDYHILYFAGHGSPKGIYLHHHRVHQDAYLVSAKELADALKGKQTRLVFLAACETSKSSGESRLLRGFAQELAELSNLPAIVAMQYYFSDQQANPLTTHFFAALAAGCPVDVAMAEARSGLIKKGEVFRDVFSPVLYLQAEDGALFPKAKNWPAISLGVALLIATIVGGAFFQIAETNQIRDWISSSQSKLRGDDELGAVLDSLRAGKNLQQSFWQSILPDSELRLAVLGQLQQTANTGQEKNRLEGHQGPVKSVVFSPDGKKLATSGEDGTARLWDTSGKQLVVLKGHQGSVKSVVFSPDGEKLATSGEDSTTRLWDTSGKQLVVLEGESVVFSPDGKKLATSAEDGTVRLWDASGKQLAVLEGESVVFSPDGKKLATSAEDGTAHLWDTSGKQLVVLKGHQGSVKSVVFSPDGEKLATSGEDDTVRLWDASGKQLAVLEGKSVVFSPDGKQLATSKYGNVSLWNTSGKQLAALTLGSIVRTRSALLDVDMGIIHSVVFSSNGKQLAIISGHDGTTLLWDTLDKHGSQVAELKGHTGVVNSVVFSPDGSQLATSGEDGIVCLWDTSSKQLAELKGHKERVDGIQFSPDGKQLATTNSEDSIVRLLNTSGKQLAILKGHKGSIYSLEFSPDGKQLATTSSKDSIARLWDTSGKQLAILKGDRVVLFSPDGKQLATTSSKDSIARLWDTSGKQLAILKGHKGKIYSLKFSPDGKKLATNGEDGTARLWDTSGKQLTEIRGVYHLDFSPDGKQLATSEYENGIVRLWNTSGKQLAVLKGHKGFLYSFDFSPDGKQLATSGEDGTARLWNTSGKQLAVLKGNQAPVLSVKFSPDGKQLATSGQDGTVRLWDTSGKQLTEIRGYQGRLFSVVFSPDGKQLSTFGGETRTSGLLRVGGIDELFSKSCDWVRDYLKNNPNIKESDRHLCDGIGTQQRSPQAQ